MPGGTELAARNGAEFLVLGPLEARVEGRSVDLGPRKQRALLAHFLVRGNEAVPVSRLVDELWPEAPPATAAHAVRVYVSSLRKALGDHERITRHGSSYALRLEPGELDLDRFRLGVVEARARLGSEPAAAAERLREALSLWRGRALADLGGEPGVRDLVLELEEERLRAAELRFDAELDAGRHAKLVPELERFLAEHPAREALYGQLMLALYRSGRQADALDVFRRARERLRDELGLEPGPALRSLQAAVLRQDPALAFEAEELRARRHLPVVAEELVGRERDLSELTELVASGGVRLVTLTGPAGAGKTRLAIAAAERLAASFRGGVWFVDLAPADDPALLVPAIAAALGVECETGRPLEDVLLAHLRDEEALLVLDGLEPMVAAAAILSRLLRSAPRIKLLVTSREPLRLYGEHRYDV
jgi:DNA-binding SARP family transcriptional activator